MRVLIEQGEVEPNFLGNSVLHYAIHNTAYSDDIFDIVRMLIVHGADAEAITKEGYSPLHRTCCYSKKRSIDMARILLENGANVNTKNDCGQSALETACRRHAPLDIQRRDPSMWLGFCCRMVQM